MEPTLTQSGALFRVHRRQPKGRFALFSRLTLKHFKRTAAPIHDFYVNLPPHLSYYGKHRPAPFVRL